MRDATELRLLLAFTLCVIMYILLLNTVTFVALFTTMMKLRHHLRSATMNILRDYDIGANKTPRQHFNRAH